MPLDSITEANLLQIKSCCLRVHGGLRNKYVGFSCWWVDCKLWVLSGDLGDQILVSIVSDLRPSWLEAKVWNLCLELL